MSDETNTESTTSTKSKAKRARKPAKAKSKMDIARSIYKKMSRGKNGPDRAKVIAAFQAKAKLTEKGASTYYQTLKSEAEAA